MWKWLKAMFSSPPEDPNAPKCPSCGAPPIENAFNWQTGELQAKCRNDHVW